VKDQVYFSVSCVVYRSAKRVGNHTVFSPLPPEYELVSQTLYRFGFELLCPVLQNVNVFKQKRRPVLFSLPLRY
jgi:hypothetical protein